MLVQISDTHVVERGKLLYGMADTARHLSESVREINAMRPRPDGVLITGDLVEHPGPETYGHFKDLIDPLEMPVYLMPGNHDNPQIMCEFFGGTGMFPATAPHYQYAIEEYPFRVLMLNSHLDDSELPSFGMRRQRWLAEQLEASDRPTLIAIHHPPFKTGVDFIDMVGPQWYAEIAEIIAHHPQVIKIVCGHGHLDLAGRMGRVPVHMIGATAHQLTASRGLEIAPSFYNVRVPPMLHHWLDGDIVSGYYPWPDDVDEKRIDKTSNTEWEALKQYMCGSIK